MDSLFTHVTPEAFIAAARAKLHVFEMKEEKALAVAGQPDYCTLPPELGGGRANVLEVKLISFCPVGKHESLCAAVGLEGDIVVVACQHCNQFFWIREKA